MKKKTAGPMTFEESLSEYLRANQLPQAAPLAEAVRKRKTIRQRLLIRIVEHAVARHLGKLSESIDWATVDWAKVLAIMLPALLQLIALFL